jgi:hypothetical protein
MIILIASRDCFTVALWHIPVGAIQLRDASVNAPDTSRYNNFLSKMGDEVRWDKHRGFKGGLTSPKSEILYFANRALEIVYHQRSYTESFIEYAQLASDNFVHVLWIEDAVLVDPVVVNLHQMLFKTMLPAFSGPLNASMNTSSLVGQPAGSTSFLILAISPLQHSDGMYLIRMYDKHSFDKEKIDEKTVGYFYYLQSLLT